MRYSHGEILLPVPELLQAGTERSDRISKNAMRNALLLCLLAIPALAKDPAPPQMPRFRWENFTTAQGLPDNKVFNVKVDGSRVWAATENGLALYENGKWKV